jgi:hypothetical protein
MDPLLVLVKTDILAMDYHVKVSQYQMLIISFYIAMFFSLVFTVFSFPLSNQF